MCPRVQAKKVNLLKKVNQAMLFHPHTALAGELTNEYNVLELKANWKYGFSIVANNIMVYCAFPKLRKANDA